MWLPIADPQTRVSPFGCPVSSYRLAIARPISSGQPAKPMMGELIVTPSCISAAASSAVITLDPPDFEASAISVSIIELLP